MLPGVLLRVVHAPIRVDAPGHLGALRQRLAHEVPDLAGLILLNALHRNLEHRATPSRRHQHARVPRLTATLRIKRRPVQRNLPELLLFSRLILRVRVQPDVCHQRTKLESARISRASVVIQPLCDRTNRHYFASPASFNAAFCTAFCKASTSRLLPITRGVR